MGSIFGFCQGINIDLQIKSNSDLIVLDSNGKAVWKGNYDDDGGCLVTIDKETTFTLVYYNQIEYKGVQYSVTFVPVTVRNGNYNSIFKLNVFDDYLQWVIEKDTLEQYKNEGGITIFM